MYLGCSFDEILQMGSGQEVSQIDKFAMVFVLDYLETSECGEDVKGGSWI